MGQEELDRLLYLAFAVSCLPSSTPSVLIDSLVIVATNITSITLLRSLKDAPVSKKYLAVSVSAVRAKLIAGGDGSGGRLYPDHRDCDPFEADEERIRRYRSFDHQNAQVRSCTVQLTGRTLVETQAPQSGTDVLPFRKAETRALLFLIMSTHFARTPKQFIVLFYPKVGVTCTLLVLISRSSLEERQGQGEFANRSASHPSASVFRSDPKSRTDRFGMSFGSRQEQRGVQKDMNASGVALRRVSFDVEKDQQIV